MNSALAEIGPRPSSTGLAQRPNQSRMSQLCGAARAHAMVTAHWAVGMARRSVVLWRLNRHWVSTMSTMEARESRQATSRWRRLTVTFGHGQGADEGRHGGVRRRRELHSGRRRLTAVPASRRTSRRGEALVGSRKNVSWDGLTVRRQWRRGPSPILAREGTSMTDGGQEASTRGGEQVGVTLGGRHRARGWRQRGGGGRVRWLLAEAGENGERGADSKWTRGKKKGGGLTRAGDCDGVWAAGNSQKRWRWVTFGEQGCAVWIR
jgi:hypothetical protein